MSKERWDLIAEKVATKHPVQSSQPQAALYKIKSALCMSGWSRRILPVRWTLSLVNGNFYHSSRRVHRSSCRKRNAAGRQTPFPSAVAGQKSQPQNYCDGSDAPAVRHELRAEAALCRMQGKQPSVMGKSKLCSFPSAGPLLFRNYLQHSLFSVFCCRH